LNLGLCIFEIGALRLYPHPSPNLAFLISLT
jgi:hypothetical protein